MLLVHAPTPTDRRVVDGWLADAGAAGLRVADDAAEAVRAAEPDDAWIVPVRVAWLPPGVDGDRRWRRRDLPTLRHAGGPSPRSRERLLAASPERCRVLVGEPAPLSELRARGGAGRLDRFVERQARLTLDRAERALTGARYKVPHDVAAQLVSDPGFQARLAALAEELQRPLPEVRTQALGYLEEMGTRQSAVVRELWARWARLLYSRAYELCVDADELQRIRTLGERHPLVFLPTHKSNLDGYVLASLLYEAGFPPNHTLGGINMAFWPLGPVGRRVGVIWIRRATRDDPVYRWVLRQYLAYLVGRRFNLEWYIEGGRTRTGKLLPPKLGLLRYLVDAVQEAQIDDVQIVPVSIVYDQLQEVAEMTAESRGAVKRAEGLTWLLDYARRQSRPSGRVRVSFGEPLAMSPALRAAGEDRRLALSKLAFEVCTRINRATPITRPGLVTLALLGVGGRSLTAAETIELLAPLQRYAEARALPGAEETRALSGEQGVTATLGELIEHGVVGCYDAGPEPVYAIGREHELVAAFYRNNVIHWFVNRAIAELALVRIADDGGDEDPAERAWRHALELRDVLKFEFFFADQERFRIEMREELQLIAPDWHATGAGGLPEVGRALAASGALMAHRVLASFLEAYHVAAECLQAAATDAPPARDAFMERCLHLGEQLRRQHRIRSGEAVSTELFGSAWKLAGNRGLTDGEPGGPELVAGRAAFASELRELVRGVHVLAELDTSLRAPAQPAVLAEAA